MASEPFLGSSESISDGNTGFNMSWWCMIRSWWSMSTSEVWLTSALSRRDLLRPLLLVLSLLHVTYDQLSHEFADSTLVGRFIVLSVDLASSAIVFSPTFFCRQDSLWRDAAYIVAYTFIWVLWLFFASMEQVYISGAPGLEYLIMLCLVSFVSVCGGTHSLAILAISVENVSFAFIYAQAQQTQSIMIFCTFTLVCSVLFEYRGGQAVADIKWAEEVLKRIKTPATSDILEIGGASRSFVDLEGKEFPEKPPSSSGITYHSGIDVVLQETASVSLQEGQVGGFWGRAALHTAQSARNNIEAQDNETDRLAAAHISLRALYKVMLAPFAMALLSQASALVNRVEFARADMEERSEDERIERFIHAERWQNVFLTYWALLKGTTMPLPITLVRKVATYLGAIEVGQGPRALRRPGQLANILRGVDAIQLQLSGGRL